MRSKFVMAISAQLAEINPYVSNLWKNSLSAIQTDAGRNTASAILFGGNFAVNSEGEWKLFRKTHYKAFHKSDRTCIATARFLKQLSDLMR